MKRLTVTALAGALMLTSLGGAVAQSRCYSSDTACRIAELEERVAWLERQLERGGRGGGNRGATLATNQSCTFDSCEALARRACETAGFARGVPSQVDSSTSWPTLKEATCYD